MSAVEPPRRSLIEILPLAITLIVASGCAVLTAHATASVAVSSGAVSVPALGWLLPIVIEGGGITAGLLAWRRTTLGEGSWPERAVFALLITLAVVVNASHAGGVAVPGWVLASAPPLALVTCVEMLLRQRSASEAVAIERVQAERAVREREQRLERARVQRRAHGERPSPESTSAVSAPAGAAPAARSQRMAMIDRLAAEHGDGLTSALLAEEAGRGDSTARRWLAEWRKTRGEENAA